MIGIIATYLLKRNNKVEEYENKKGEKLKIKRKY